MSKTSSAISKFIDVANKFYAQQEVIDHSLEEEKAILKDSFYEFVKAAWPYCGSTQEFRDNWHIRVICEHMEEFFTGGITYFLLNIPIRMGKSSLICVLFPAWVWINDPKAQFLFGSYALEFARRDSSFCNELISSEWYKKRWGSVVKLTRRVNNIDKFRLTAGGSRQIISVGSSVTGMNADYIIIDDANNVSESESVVTQNATNRWWSHAASLRFNDLRRMRKMVVQQRVHENDLSGHILSKDNDNLTHLFMPMEYEPFRHCVTVPIKSSGDIPWEDPRTDDGELLWPTYVDNRVLREMKQDLGGEYAIAGQLQQRPSPAAGGIIKKEWFQWWCDADIPQSLYTLQSWDTAYSGIDKNKISRDKTTCFSACTTWGIFEDEHQVPNVMLLHSWKGKVEFPELRNQVQNLYSMFRPHMVLIEAKANGLSLLQDIRRLGIMATQFNPTPYGSKEMRARRITHLLEAGRVWVPAKAPHFEHLKPFAHEFVDACSLFPNGLSNDLVDSMSQALIKLYTAGLFVHPEDEKPKNVYRLETLDQLY